MKRFLLTFMLGFTGLTMLMAQTWTWQNPLPQGNDLKADFFIDANTGYVVGRAGTVMKTTDGGVSWGLVNLDEFTSLYGIYFLSATEGYVCGQGDIYETTDGGNTWSNIYSSTSPSFMDIEFIDANNGFAVSESGTALYQTTDGGVNWTGLDLTSTDGLNDIYFHNSTDGYAVGENGLYIYTIDGGATWTETTIGSNNRELHKIFFLDDNTAFAMGYYGSLFKSTDGGDSWTLYIDSYDHPDHNTDEYMIATNTDIYFSDATTGYIVAEYAIWKTIDAGDTWTKQNHDSYIDMSVLLSTGSSTIYATGEAGLILKSTDSGETWSYSNTEAPLDLFGIDFIDANTGYAVGNKNTIIKTTDGGSSWTSVFNPSSGFQYFKDVFILDENNIYVANQDGSIYWSNDAGSSWQSNSVGVYDDFNCIQMINTTTGYASGLDNILAKTTDGTTWATITGPLAATNDINSLYFFDASVGFVAGGAYNESNLYKTTDGGDTWTEVSVSVQEEINDITFINSTNGYLVSDDGKIMATTDGGDNWTEQTVTIPTEIITDNLLSVQFADENHGAIAGTSGLTIVTEDGGTTWTVLDRATTNYLQSVDFVGNHAVFAGNNGNIMSTPTNYTPPSIIAAFTANVTTGDAPLTVNFTDASTGSPTSWSWDFDNDGTEDATTQNPSYEYTTAGTYTVKLTVTNADGSDTETKTDYITVNEASGGEYLMTTTTITTDGGMFYDDGGAGVEYSNDVNDTITFIPATTGKVLRFVFDVFDIEDSSDGCDYDALQMFDGEEAIAENLIGTYCNFNPLVEFVATNASGAVTFVFISDGTVNYQGWEATITSELSATSLIADFSADQTTGTAPLTVNFTDASTGSPTSWSWDFDNDGTEDATDQNPTYEYSAAGTYSVALTVSDGTNSDTETKTDYITVASTSGDITSTTTGGPWSETTTWIGGVVPAATDNVVIDGDVYVDGNVTCNNLTINADDSLRNNTTYQTINVNGSLINNGIIADNPQAWYLTVKAYGDVTNNGIWENSYTEMSGTANQTLTMAADAVFAKGRIEDTDSTSTITAGSNLYFSDDLVIDLEDGNNREGQLILPTGAGYNLYLDSCEVQHAWLMGNGNQLHMGNWARLSNETHLDNFTLKGNINITGSSNVFFEGDNIVLDDTLQNHTSYETVIFNGLFTNNGVVRDNPDNWYLTIKANGDIINNGVWENSYTEMSGTTNQTLTMAADAVFAKGRIEDTDSTSTITAGSNLYFSDDLVIDLEDGNNREGQLILPTGAGYNLYLDSCEVQHAWLMGNGNQLHMSNWARLSNETHLDNFILKGNINITGSSNVFFEGDNNVLEDTLQNHTSYETVIFNGLFTNNGVVRDNPDNWYLTIKVNGDIINNGIWENSYTEMSGTANQTLTMAADAIFAKGRLEDTDSTSTLTAGSSLYFYDDFIIDLEDNSNQEGQLILPTGADYNLYLDSCEVQHAWLMGYGNQLHMSNYARLSNETHLDNFILKGNINITGSSNVFFEGDNNVLEDTLQNHTSYETVIINGTFTNNGVVRDNPDNWNLTIIINGDFANNGIWTNSYSEVKGEQDQQLTFGSEQTFDAGLEFYAMTGTDSYQWYQDGTVIDGETSNTYSLAELNADKNGVYYCSTNEGNSRNITISGIVNQDPPVAAFSATPLSGVYPVTVQFTDESTGTPTSWSWDFDNDGTEDANEQNPNYTYNSAGSYTIVLTATNDNGSDTETKTGYITVESPIEAGFTAGNTTGSGPLTVNFTDASSSSATSWEWNFGDGNTSTDQNPTHTYNASGKFSVTLTVSDGTNSKTTTKVNLVQINETQESREWVELTYDFGGDDFEAIHFASKDKIFMGSREGNLFKTSNGGNSWVSLSFTNRINAIDFVDPNAGYLVGYDLIQRTLDGGATWVDVSPDFLDFMLYDVDFINRNFGIATGYRSGGVTDGGKILVTRDGGNTWENKYTFGHDIIRSVCFPSETIGYATGDDKTVVKTEDAGETWTKINPTVETNFAFNTIYFLNESTGFVAGNSGHVYKTTNGGNTWTEVTSNTTFDIFDLYFVNETTGYYVTQQGRVGVTTDAGATWSTTTLTGNWMYGVHFQSENTGYAVGLGGAVFSFEPVETVVADFSADATSGDAPLTVNFTDLSTGTPTSWSWDFDNDGTEDASTQNPTHTFNTAGTYTVALTVLNDNGTDTQLKTDYITVTTAVEAEFSADLTSGNAPLTVNFTDVSSGDLTSWSWDFNNDGTEDSDIQNPTYTFNAAGTYTVSLTVSDGTNSATETKTDYITVNEVSCLDPTDYVMNFEPEDDMTNWVYYDANQDENHWITVADEGINGTQCAAYQFSTVNAADDYLISPCFEMTKGKSYEISFYYASAGDTFYEQLKVLYGTSFDALNNEVVDLGSFAHSDYQKSSTVVNINATDSYYFGWYCYSNADSWNIYVDSVRIREVNGVDVPDNLAAGFSIFPNPAHDELNVELDNFDGLQQKVELFTLAGQKVMEKAVTSQKETIQIDDLEKGIYFVKVSDSKTATIKKLVIQ